MIVPIDEVKVKLGTYVSQRSVKSIMATLQRQGLIEPLIVDENNFVGYRIYDAERLIAAKNLGWDTVIIVGNVKRDKS